jgi:hypothetical protein
VSRALGGQWDFAPTGSRNPRKGRHGPPGLPPSSLIDKEIALSLQVDLVAWPSDAVVFTTFGKESDDSARNCATVDETSRQEEIGDSDRHVFSSNCYHVGLFDW